jgi:hypothetical protein
MLRLFWTISRLRALSVSMNIWPAVSVQCHRRVPFTVSYSILREPLLNDMACFVVSQ